MEFDGSFKKTRGVRLGGRSTSKQRSELVSETREDRLRRLDLRNRNRAASSLQRFWRERRVVRAEYHSARAAWDKEFDQVGAAMRTGTKPTAVALHALSARLILFYNVTKDLPRAQRLCLVLLSNAMNTADAEGNVVRLFRADGNQNKVADQNDDDNDVSMAKRAQFVFGRLLRLAIRDGMSSASAHIVAGPNVQLNVFLKTVDVFTDPAVARAVGVAKDVPLGLFLDRCNQDSLLHRVRGLILSPQQRPVDIALGLNVVTRPFLPAHAAALQQLEKTRGEAQEAELGRKADEEEARVLAMVQQGAAGTTTTTSSSSNSNSAAGFTGAVFGSQGGVGPAWKAVSTQEGLSAGMDRLEAKQLAQQARREKQPYSVYVHMARQLLSVPVLGDLARSNPNMATMLGSASFWEQVMGSLFQRSKALVGLPATPAPHFPNTATWLLGNLMEHGEQLTSQAARPETTTVFTAVLGMLISHLPRGTLSGEAAEEMDAPDSDDDEGDHNSKDHAGTHGGTSSGHGGAGGPDSGMDLDASLDLAGDMAALQASTHQHQHQHTPMPQSLRNSIERLRGKAFVQALFTMLVETQDASTTSEVTAHVCTFFGRLLANSTSSKRALLTLVMLVPGSIRYLWAWLDSAGARARLNVLMRSLMQGTPLAPMAREFAAVLDVFAQTYGHLLTTLDDQEFFDKGVPFDTKTELPSMIRTLKTFCFMAFRTPDPVAASGVISSTAGLLTQLHHRDIRQQYMPENTWAEHHHVPPVKEFVQAVIEEMDQDDAEATTQEGGGGGGGGGGANGTSTSVFGKSDWSRLLREMPYLIPFDHRVKIFTTLLYHEGPRYGGAQFRVRRGTDFFDDAFDAVSQMTPDQLRRHWQIQFFNELGLEEAGIDGGGLFKEFLSELCKRAFSEYGLFEETPDHHIYPSPNSALAHDNHLQLFRFLGRVVGKAIQSSVLVDVKFAGFFLNKLLGRYNFLNDLGTLDAELQRNLLKLKHYEGDVSELGLTFSINHERLGKVEEVELVPGGRDVTVTNQNRIQYVYLVSHYKLNTQIRTQYQSFLGGVCDVIPVHFLRLFDQRELEMLISGAAEDYEADDLKQHTVLHGYDQDSPQIQWFWEIVREFTPDERAKLQAKKKKKKKPM